MEKEVSSSESKSKERVPSISYFTLYRFATKWDIFLITVSVLSAFIAGITLPYAITLVANVFQNMINYAKALERGTQDNEVFLRSMHQFGVHYSCVGVVLLVSGYFGAAFMNITAINQIFKLRQEYFKAALNQDFAYYDVRQTGDFASKMADDVIKLEEGIGHKVSVFVYNLSIGVSCIIMALVKGWKLALICITSTPVTLMFVALTGKIANRLSKKVTEESGHASAIAQEVLASIRTVYAFNGQQKEIQRYSEPLRQARKICIRKDVFTGLSMGFLFFGVFCSYALSFYIGIYLVVYDPINYNADVMFSVFFGIMTAFGTFGMVGSMVETFGAARGAGAHIFHLLDNVPIINPLLERGITPYTAEGTIELKNVTFQYPSRPDVPVLNGVSLTVKRGQSVALVGHSGCGKSTIIQLISRYYDVINGCVCLDGYDVRELSVRWLRAQIGLVGQEPVLFNASVRENIRYGWEDARDADVEAAATQANAHHFIVKLPKGYDTFVGERRAALSGGQKQRIAIARALVRNPRVLLLDEATSALDIASEAKVQMALEKAAQGRTTVVVAHRLSTIRNADMIYVMKQGELVEYGNHGELIAMKGQYFNMIQIQEPQETDGRLVVPVREESELSAEEVEDEFMTDELDECKKSHASRLSFWRVVALNAPEWKSITIGSVGSIIIGFAMPIFIVIFGDLFGTMSDQDPKKLLDKVKDISIICILIGIIMGISNLIETVSFGVAGAYLTERLRLRMFAHLLRQQVAYFEERCNSTGALCVRLSAEAAYVHGATGQRIGICLQGVGSVGLALVLAMLFEWRVGLVALTFLPLIVVVVYYQAKITSTELTGNVKTLENSTKIAIEAVSNVRTVASLGREDKFLKEYTAQLVPALAPARRSAHFRGLVAGLSRSMFNFVNAAALTYGGHLIVSAGVAYEDILITTQSLQMASGQAQNAFTFAPDFQKGIDAASRIVILLNTKPKILDPESPSITEFKTKGEASFQDVEFKYPNRPKVKVLTGLNLKVSKVRLLIRDSRLKDGERDGYMRIEHGKTIALVGRSGCGKSTVIQLLQRYYDPDLGVVCLDEIPLPNLRLSDVHASFGLVSQEPVLFNLTIKENIAYGDNSRTPAYEEIVEAAKQANIHNFIIALPQAYDTYIGFNGTQLSGGQKQRVAIARALIRRPKILLLDEATSALDTESEKVVQEALEAAKADRTCVLIAHRLSTVRDADRICVLADGQVAESGDHELLMERKGLYYKLNTSSHT